MAESSIFWLRVAAGLYAVGLLHSMLAVVRRKHSLYSVALGAFQVGVVLHAVAIVELTMAYGRLAVDNVYVTLGLGAFLIAMVFLIVEWKYRFETTSVALFPLIFLMTLVAAMQRPVASWPNVQLRDAWLVIHIILVLAGFAALLLTAVASIFYLIQERRLKSKRLSTFFEKLPPLATLDNMISGSMGLGFVLLTLGVIFAVTWAFVESGTRWIGDPKIQLSLLTWLLCLLMIFFRTSAGWRGRRAALMALTVLGCSALTWAAHVGLRPTLIP